jgi:hypothetical protein
VPAVEVQKAAPESFFESTPGRARSTLQQQSAKGADARHQTERNSRISGGALDAATVLRVFSEEIVDKEQRCLFS